jgi:hypothetical protein
MVRIDITADGLVSIREPHEPHIGKSMTVLEQVRDRHTAEMVIVTLCKLMYSDNAVRRLSARLQQDGVAFDGDGCDTAQSAGFTGYMYAMPDDSLPLDDRLSLVQDDFQRVLKIFDKGGQS